MSANDFLYNFQVARYIQVAAAAVVVYDHVTTIDLEFELMRKRRRSFVELLFIVNRYLGTALPVANLAISLLVTTINYHKECSLRFNLSVWGTCVMLWSMQAIMQYRIYAMYRCSRKVLLFLIVCFTAQAVSMAWILAVLDKGSAVIVKQFPQIRLCTAISPKNCYILWIPVILFEFILFGFALRKGLQHSMIKGRVVLSPRSSVSSVLMRDSILFPALTATIYIISLAIWHPFIQYGADIAAAFVGVICRLIGSHLILNLRDAYYLPFEEEVSVMSSFQAYPGVGEHKL